ncbi:MAG: RnfABCDGE type electron transport complex subunit G [gamma proteobacterium symbiont of Bathyaustriella thionipta]|nr:RnfABCDGE type electron transport complex subunit G [gamma proteobacterium symbiont of Bathyaustriella thionipta]MCU7948904.1 RnfABCDGE type electron transport complex subunit G [gamma proteobacterium symbiont of Bathyaustriella thionipta]MCU7953206.1 RnfABCDGE type electron transport complex subunit G [gamma proteobacterium symbiont of Bathyaustriella thionipta]MCU7955478.1 RnfABCDGE type electron transport complex subunit G [gamma proteobacterium symbiont of Bathyaustriella thionipta]MCU79
MNTANITSSTHPSAQNQEPGSSRLVISMAVAGFISGVIIIAIYMLTFDTIKENKARELREAVFRVLPDVSHMQKLHFVDNKMVVVKSDGMDDEMIFAGYDKDAKFIGYAIQGKAPGFQDTVHILYGYLSSNSNITGMAVLESRETPGLGDKIFKDMDFVSEFINLPMHKDIKAVKKGTKTQENEIDAITGATISSKIVVKIINQAFKKWSPRLPQQGSEPALELSEVKVVKES